MGDLPAVIVSGLVSGSAYALLALGIVIIFRSTDTVNFAIGDMGTLGVFVAGTLISMGLPVAAGLLAAIVTAGLVGVGSAVPGWSRRQLHLRRYAQRGRRLARGRQRAA